MMTTNFSDSRTEKKVSFFSIEKKFGGHRFIESTILIDGKMKLGEFDNRVNEG